MKLAPSEILRSRRPVTAAIPDPALLSQIALLTNGSYSLRLHGHGGGYSEHRDMVVTRPPSDPTADPDGFFLYLSDVENHVTWSAGYRPTRITPSTYQFQSRAGAAEIARVDFGIECRLCVGVSSQFNYEVRLCRLTNLTTQRRRLEITSYLEWVLGNRDFDAGHPAFSKLFVETKYCPTRDAIIAHRRARHAGESPRWGFHTVALNAAIKRNEIGFETNRARFIGRGRTLECPRALDPGARLSGNCGSVLDPIASIRLPVELGPGETQEFAFVLGAATTEREVDRMLESVRVGAQATTLFNEASVIELDAGLLKNAAWLPSTDGNGERYQVHPPHRKDQQAAIGPATAREFMPEPLRGEQEQVDCASGPLEFDNGYGGFSGNGREYSIHVRADGSRGQHRPPMPWVNVIANEVAGFLVTESGAGYTWSGNSRLNRLTAWHNDPVIDPHSEGLWIRDEDAGVFWSPMPGPTPSSGDYLVRHGLGYTTFEHRNCELAQETTLFMPLDAPVKITRCRITNDSGQIRRLSLFHYLRWALGGLAAETAGNISTTCDTTNRVIWATNPNRPHYGGYSAFSTVSPGPSDAAETVAFTCSSESFIGDGEALSSPKALECGGQLDPSASDGQQPCAAWQVSIELRPNETFECSFLLGETTSRDEARRLMRDFSSPEQIQSAYDAVTGFWNDMVSAIAVETPCREIDLMVNGWLLYQNLSCRIWARSAYYQPGGAFGFRDQLQDSAAFIYHRPDITRAQILRHAAQQFQDGDVLHWWHPDTGYGVRTRFSDDLLWLPYVAAEYVRKTGDVAILDEAVPFISAPPLEDGQQEAYLRPSVAEESATLYEHCCRALDRGLTIGRNGLPLIGCGDWNDGFSRVGHLGRGESVWLGFFIDHVLEQMLPLCNERGDDRRQQRYLAYREQLRLALNSAGWDGAWYRRAYYDNGQPLGSATSDECQIDALAQAWSVLSGIAPPDRAQMAMEAVESRLIDDNAGIIRLLTPAFDSTPNDPGYIKGYLPGIRENGGQYTHGVLWVVRAFAEMGNGARAVELLRLLTPVWHTDSPEKVQVYQTEPYAVAADIYGEPPHVGRGGWTWYTGSAGWMYRVAVESIFGITTEHGRTLLVNPSIAPDWPQCRVAYRLPDGQTRYEITIENPSGKQHGVTQATLDGQPTVVLGGVARIPIASDRQNHRVVVRL